MISDKPSSNPCFLFLLTLSLGLRFVVAEKPEADRNGYIMFCPCMGKSFDFSSVQMNMNDFGLKPEDVKRELKLTK